MSRLQFHLQMPPWEDREEAASPGGKSSVLQLQGSSRSVLKSAKETHQETGLPVFLLALGSLE